jgi:hypothetical protein
MFRSRRCDGIMDSALPSRLNGLPNGGSGRGLCVSGCSVVEALRRRPSRSRSRSGICTRGKYGPRSPVLCLRVERGALMDVCTPCWRTGSVRGEEIDGRLCKKSVMELREERARDSLVRERAGALSPRPDEPASCRPYNEEKRRRGFLRWAAGLEWSCVVWTSSGTLSLSACDERFSSEGAHEVGRVLRRGRGSGAPEELACPML